ncbi:hypothetical protein TNCV_1561271 [Trichonephila clavipes]|nr:hypothetical protein TNCV_1561271 [Trichonephila clavipes]
MLARLGKQQLISASNGFGQMRETNVREDKAIVTQIVDSLDLSLPSIRHLVLIHLSSITHHRGLGELNLCWRGSLQHLPSQYTVKSDCRGTGATTMELHLRGTHSF